MGGGGHARNVGEPRLRGLIQADAEEGLQIGLPLALGQVQVGIEALQQPRAPGRVDVAGPELADLAFLEDVVAAQHLVGPFAREHHLVAVVAHQAREQHHGHGRGAQNRLLAMPDGPGKGVSDIGIVEMQETVAGAEMVDHHALIVAFVQRLFLEADGKGAQIRALPVHQRGEHGRVEPTREIGPHRHVGAQTNARGFA